MHFYHRHVQEGNNFSATGGFKNLPQFESLNFGANELEETGALSSLPELKTLNFHSNKLKSFPVYKELPLGNLACINTSAGDCRIAEAL